MSAAPRQPASRLLQDLQKTRGLLPFNDEAVRSVFAETEAMATEIRNFLMENTDDIPPAVMANLTVSRLTVSRNKRCLLAYFMHRAERIEQLRWNSGPQLGAKEDLLSSEEKDYFKQYCDIVTRYNTALGENFDITAGTKPPINDKIMLLALADCGAITTAKSSIEVKKGQNLMMSRAEAEPWIRKGMMRELPWAY